MYSYSAGKNRHNPSHFVDFTILFSEKQVCKTATEIKLFKLIGKSDCKVSRDVQPILLQTLLLVKTRSDRKN